uniref:Uncharacterized protein n=1 Tax=Megaselia scalaris TaxID=36166 RepID=T1GMU5_MEGSC
MPSWAKLLVIFCIYMDKDKMLQIYSISVFIDILCILKLNKQDPEQLLSYSSDLLPILHFVESNPKVFQDLTSILWNYLGDSDLDSLKIVSLLYQIHNFLNDSLVEEV